MTTPLPPDRAMAAARAQLGLDEAIFLIGVFGVLNDSKRPGAILAAMRDLVEQGVLVKAAFIGRENDTFHLAEEAPRLGLMEQVMPLGFVEELETINVWMAACDVAINLRSPYWGETSASTLRILAAGTPVVVNDIGAFAELPDAASVKLPPDNADLPGALALALRQLVDQPERRAAMRIAARQYAAAEHDPRRVAVRY